jgi:hypothetical protein
MSIPAIRASGLEFGPFLHREGPKEEGTFGLHLSELRPGSSGTSVSGVAGANSSEANRCDCGRRRGAAFREIKMLPLRDD